MDEPKIQTVNTYSIIHLELIIYNGVQVNSKEKNLDRIYRLKIYKLLAKFVSLT